MVAVLGLAASARRHGNTSLPLDRALAGAAEAGATVSLDTAAVKHLDAAIRAHLKGGGIAVVSTHVPLKTKFAHQLTLGLEEEA